MDEEIRENYQKEIIDANKQILKNTSNMKNINIYANNKSHGTYENSDVTHKNKYTLNDISIVMCVKNRPLRSKMFLEMNLPNIIKYKIELIIVEGKSHNMIDLSCLKNIKFIKHHIVDLGDVWSRSILLNYGVLKATREIVILSDVDFAFMDSLWENLEKVFTQINMNEKFLGLPLYETNDTMNINGEIIRKKYKPYSACYAVKKSLLIKVGGFNTKFIGFGFEERELQKRFMKVNVTTVYSSFIVPQCFVLHYSHTDKLRDKEDLEKNRKIYFESDQKCIKYICSL
jgi:hypothetical protein